MRNTKSGFLCATALVAMMASNGCGSSSGGGEAGSGGTSTGSGKGGSSAGSSSANAGSSGSAGSSGGSSSRSSSSSGGTTPTGGSSSASSVPNCPVGPTCGGDLVGTWTVSSNCLSFSGDMDGVPGSLGCPKLPVTGTLDVTGTWTAKGDKTYLDKTKTTGKIAFDLDPSCLTVSKAPVTCDRMGFAFNTLGWTDVTCAEKNGKCSCAGTTEKTGGLGTASPYSMGDGDYETSGSDLTLDNQIEFSYCVDGNKLTLTPKPGILPLKGTIVLQKGTGGTGGGGSTGSSTGGTTTSSSSKGGSTGGTVTGGTTGSSSKSGTGGTVTGGTSGSAGASGGSTVVGTGSRPCDIYAAANVKCAAAHSTTRALYAAYSGKLYRIRRDSDKTYQDIGTIEPGGVADSSVQEEFCKNTKCTLTRVWDQSGNGNYVDAETQDAEEVSARPKAGNNGMSAANAMQEALTVGGKKVYALYMKTAQAYWHDGSKSGMPLGKEPQGIYMVTSGKHYGDGCCFNYGNGPLGRVVTACGTIDAVNFSSNKIWDYGAGSGPWVMADFECGLVAGGKGKVPTMSTPYVTAIEKNKGTGDYVLRGGDSQKGSLTTLVTTKLPYTIDKKGAIDLGSGGDCCYSNTTMSQGNFYEGAIIAGYPSDEVEDKVQENIVSAGYKELQ